MKFEVLSDYIVKVSGVLSSEQCIELEKGVSENLAKDLLKIQAEVFDDYLKGFIPDGLLVDFDVKRYSFELDSIKHCKADDGFYNAGGANKAKRFLTLLFVVNNGAYESRLNFPLQNVVNICRFGDLYILPANFPHRFRVELVGDETFTAVGLHMCFVMENVQLGDLV